MSIDYFTRGTLHAGLTYERWTVEWWRWALSIPTEKNPVVDITGENADEGQPQNVWFLAGIFAEENEKKEFPSRECKIPTRLPILIPILNCAADTIHYPELEHDGDILDHVTNQIQRVEKRKCYVNGQSIPPEKVASDPIIFRLYIHPDFDKFHKGGKSRASADGFWVFLKPLPEGEYMIEFEGAYKEEKLCSGARYKISVV
jgi:hypothetical protein